MTIALDDLVKKSKPIAVAKQAAAPEKKLPVWGNAPWEPPPMPKPGSKTYRSGFARISSSILRFFC